MLVDKYGGKKCGLETCLFELEYFNHFLAEGTGFEPAVACATTVFKTVTIVHSVTPPRSNFEAKFHWLMPHGCQKENRLTDS